MTATASASPPPLLSVEELSVDFRTRTGTVKALDRVSFRVGKGEMVGVVGESGSGKSVAAYTLMGILDAAGRVTHGRAVFGGLDLTAARERDLLDIRGREMSMIFQSPRTSLNPIRTVGRQIGDVLRQHGDATRHNARARAMEALARVRIPDPERRVDAYPFEMSGGMCQRVMIALALACEPRLLIADEPTTGLDVTTQMAVMELIGDLARSHDMATLLITHDLALAAEYCDRIVVMHAGHVVETAPSAELFRAPRHPYTARLMAATPAQEARLADLAAIPGGLPDLRAPDLPPCRFSARCERRADLCDEGPLTLTPLAPDHAVACRRPL